jgi:hypothetical protein
MLEQHIAERLVGEYAGEIVDAAVTFDFLKIVGVGFASPWKWGSDPDFIFRLRGCGCRSSTAG